MSTGRTLRQFQFVAEQVGEEVVAPLGWRLGPSDFEAAADGVSTKTFAKFILPSQALVLDVGAFWFGAHVVGGNRGTVGLAERMPAGNQCDCFFVIHGPAAKCFANVPGSSAGIRLSIQPCLGHVNSAHSSRC